MTNARTISREAYEKLSDPEVRRARAAAVFAHAARGQKRKYTGEPYHTHPDAVALLVAEIPSITDIRDVIVAYLHDVVDDTDVTLKLISEEFGVVVAERVAFLSHAEYLPEDDRATRKLKDRLLLQSGPRSVHTVKLADVYVNLSGYPVMLEQDPEFAKIYVPEKFRVLQCLDLGDRELREKTFALAHHIGSLLNIDLPTR